MSIGVLPNDCSTKTSNLLANRSFVHQNTVTFKEFRISCGLETNPAKRTSEISEEILHTKPDAASGTDYTLYNIYDHQHEIVNIGFEALGPDDPLLIAIKKLITLSKLDDNRQPTKKDFTHTKKIKAQVISRIASVLKKQNKLSSKQAHAMAIATYKDAQVKYINNKPWSTFENHFSHQQHSYCSVQIPCADMKLGHLDIFEHAYEGKGVCSGDTVNAIHATNLWQSRLSVKENGQLRTLFSGIRHGVLSPYDGKDPCKRKKGAENKAREVLCAALFSKPDLLARALNNEVVDLKIVSTGLLTATNIFVKEATMLDEQMQAWRSLTESGKVQEICIRNKNDELQTIKVRPQVVAFNVGVDELALKFGFGNNNSDKYNARSLKKLSGWVKEYLQTNPENSPRVHELAQQIEIIWKKKLHHKDGKEPYKLAQRIAMLAYEIKVVPCWNCKSGKDRTGMLDAEIKREAISVHQSLSKASSVSFPDKEGRNIFQKTLLNSGNLEIQKQNTCGAGNKVLTNLWPSIFRLSVAKRIGNTATCIAVKGISQCVSF